MRTIWADADLETTTAPQTFVDVLTDLYRRRYTGSITLHCAEGLPKKVEFPGQQITLIQRKADPRGE